MSISSFSPAFSPCWRSSTLRPSALIAFHPVLANPHAKKWKITLATLVSHLSTYIILFVPAVSTTLILQNCSLIPHLHGTTLLHILPLFSFTDQFPSLAVSGPLTMQLIRPNFPNIMQFHGNNPARFLVVAVAELYFHTSSLWIRDIESSLIIIVSALFDCKEKRKRSKFSK